MELEKCKSYKKENKLNKLKDLYRKGKWEYGNVSNGLMKG